jgi:hypothetical protein
MTVAVFLEFAYDTPLELQDLSPAKLSKHQYSISIPPKAMLAEATKPAELNPAEHVVGQQGF